MKGETLEHARCFRQSQKQSRGLFGADKECRKFLGEGTQDLIFIAVNFCEGRVKPLGAAWTKPIHSPSQIDPNRVVEEEQLQTPMKANCMKKKDFVDFHSRTKSFVFKVLAERKGLEPSASGVTGRRYNRLNYRSAVDMGWWAVQDLNL